MAKLETEHNFVNKELLSPEEIEPGITPPQHLVIIPDGNRRWARERGLPASEGHKQGVRAAKDLMRVCRDFRKRGL